MLRLDKLTQHGRRLHGLESLWLQCIPIAATDAIRHNWSSLFLQGLGGNSFNALQALVAELTTLCVRAAVICRIANRRAAQSLSLMRPSAPQLVAPEAPDSGDSSASESSVDWSVVSKKRRMTANV